MCNGCQLLALLGWVGEGAEDGAGERKREGSHPSAVDSNERRHETVAPPPDNEVALTHNQSGRFESRFVSVGIQKSPSIWLRGMEGSALGCWVAHGEGSGHVTGCITVLFIPSSTGRHPSGCF